MRGARSEIARPRTRAREGAHARTHRRIAQELSAASRENSPHPQLTPLPRRPSACPPPAPTALILPHPQVCASPPPHPLCLSYANAVAVMVEGGALAAARAGRRYRGYPTGEIPHPDNNWDRGCVDLLTPHLFHTATNSYKSLMNCSIYVHILHPKPFQTLAE